MPKARDLCGHSPAQVQVSISREYPQSSCCLHQVFYCRLCFNGTFLLPSSPATWSSLREVTRRIRWKLHVSYKNRPKKQFARQSHKIGDPPSGHLNFLKNRVD